MSHSPSPVPLARFRRAASSAAHAIAPAAARPPAPAAAAEVPLGGDAALLFDLLNAERFRRGLTSVRVYPTLQVASAWMVSDLAARDTLDGRLARTPLARAAARLRVPDRRPLRGELLRGA